MLSKNIKITPDSPQSSKEKLLFRPQIFKYKYSTCLEKLRYGDLDYDPDTMKSLQNLMLNASTAAVTRNSPLGEDAKNERCGGVKNVFKSQHVALPQWLKFDKSVLRFYGYFNEPVHESAHETYRIHKISLLYYLEDDTVQISENRVENSGIPQGQILRRHRVKSLKIPKNDLTWKNLKLGQSVEIYGKIFRICGCDQFTRNFFAKNGVEIGEEEKVPEIDWSKKYEMVDFEEMRRNIMEIKEFTEVGLGGGHPNGGLKQFLENDRKVLSFDISWFDEKYDKEEKRYKMNYYLSDGQIEICEIKANNSGKAPFPLLLRKSKLPKKAHMTYCPGIEVQEDEYYGPEDLVTGKFIDVYGRNCHIVGCDEFTRKWYKKNLGVNMESIKLKTKPPQNTLHPIPPHNGFGSEEDSLLNVKYLNPQGKVREYITEKFKRDKHILRYKAKLISSVPSDEERRFLISFFLRDEAVQVFEIAGKNSGRTSCKFYEK